VSEQKLLIRREILARRETLVGTVKSDPVLIAFDGSGSGAETWVVDVDVGGSRLLRDVPVKCGERGRFYSQRGQTVALRRNALGRFDVVAQADRIIGTATVKQYDLNAGLETGSALQGFEVVTRALEFYQGTTAMKGNPAVQFFRLGGADDVISRASGSFIAEGFAAGQQIRVGGKTTLNQGVLTILAVPLAGFLTFAGDVLQNEGPLDGVTIGRVGTSRWGDGVLGFPAIEVIDQATGLPV
jgi:hypothetical protein